MLRFLWLSDQNECSFAIAALTPALIVMPALERKAMLFISALCAAQTMFSKMEKCGIELRRNIRQFQRMVVTGT